MSLVLKNTPDVIAANTTGNILEDIPLPLETASYFSIIDG